MLGKKDFKTHSAGHLSREISIGNAYSRLGPRSFSQQQGSLQKQNSDKNL